MANVKIDIHNKSIPDKIKQARSVLTTLGTPPPAAYATAAATLKTATDKLEQDSGLYDAKNKEAEVLLLARDGSETAFDQAINGFGSQVQTTTNGDEAAIVATGLAVRAAASKPATDLDVTTGFSVTTTNAPGTFDFSWDKMKGVQVSELRWRKQSDPATQFAGTKSTTKTRLRLSGFDSGVPYVFQLRGHGAGEVESPWCDPFTKIAS